MSPMVSANADGEVVFHGASERFLPCARLAGDELNL